MSSYKLKKWYPSLPKDWEVGMEIKLMGDMWNKRIPVESRYKYHQILSDEVNNPEFWEKVIEKDYEVLSFKATDKHPGANNVFSILNTTNNYTYEYSSIPCTLEEMLKSVDKGYNIIYSVKRLSDGEIFTIGDKTNSGIICEFRINTTGMYKDILIVGFERNMRMYPFIDSEFVLQHVKQPVFKTEDGVDICLGDNYRCVNINTFFTHNCTCDKYSNIKDDNFKYFSTKKAAIDYIIMNKPCLSINDVLSVGQRVIVDEGKLKQIVKSKL